MPLGPPVPRIFSGTPLGQHDDKDLIRKAMPKKMVRDRLRHLAPEGLAVDLFTRFCPDAHDVIVGDPTLVLVVLGNPRGDRRELVRDDQNLVRGEPPACPRRDENRRHHQR